MARFARKGMATNATIRNFFKRGLLIGSRYAPGSLKLTLMGMGRRGGVLLRQEKLRRKVGRQLRGARQKTTRLEGT